MSLAAVALVWASSLFGAPVDVAQRAFVELETERASYFVGEPFVVRVRVGVEQTFLHDHLVQLFARALDVPIQVQASWLGTFPATDVSLEAKALARLATFALNDSVVESTRLADRSVDGRTFTVLQIERRVVVSDAGPFTLPAPRLAFAYATRFDDDLLRGRVALDRQDATIDGASHELEIVPVPLAGRPRDYTGAIGQFTLRASTNARDVDLGRPFTLTVTIEGAGNLAEFAVPAWDALDGLHVLGVLDRVDGSRRTISLEVAATRPDITAIPPITIAAFDPAGGGAFTTIRSDAIPLTVHGESPAAPVASDANESTQSSRGKYVAVLTGLGLVLVVVLARRARPGVDAHDVEIDARRRADEALAAFRTRVASEPTALEQALLAYFAARLACSEAAVIAPEFGTRLVRAGVSDADAHEAVRCVETLVHARYGGAAAGVDARRLLALVERIDATRVSG